MHLQNIHRMSKNMKMTSDMVVMKPTQNEVYAQMVELCMSKNSKITPSIVVVIAAWSTAVETDDKHKR